MLSLRRRNSPLVSIPILAGLINKLRMKHSNLDYFEVMDGYEISKYLLNDWRFAYPSEKLDRSSRQPTAPEVRSLVKPSNALRILNI